MARQDGIDQVAEADLPTGKMTTATEMKYKWTDLYELLTERSDDVFDFSDLPVRCQFDDWSKLSKEHGDLFNG